MFDGDAPQLVELGIVAGRDHVTFAQQHRGFFGDGPLQQPDDVVVIAHGLRELDHQRRFYLLQHGAQRGQHADRGAQRREITRPRAAQRHAAQDALDVADGAQRFAQALEAARVDQQRQRLVAAPQFLLVGQRTIEPAPQLARAHRRGGGVQQREQGGGVLARQRGVDLQVAARGGIELQRVAAFLDREPGDVRQRGPLRLAHVLQQGARGADRQRQIVGAEAAQVERAELVREQARGAGKFEMPGRTHARFAVQQRTEFARLVFGNENFGGLEAFELGGQRRLAVRLEYREAPRGQVQPREAERHALLARAPHHGG